MHYINKNYELKPIYNNENEYIDDTLSVMTKFNLMNINEINVKCNLAYNPYNIYHILIYIIDKVD